MARDFGSAESTEIAGILCVFPNFGTARMGQKTRHPAVAELFRGSLVRGILRTLHDEEHSRFQELESLIQEKNDTKEILTNFITKLEDLTGEQTEFREELWGGLVDHIRIDEKSSTVVFRGGIEITI